MPSPLVDPCIATIPATSRRRRVRRGLLGAASAAVLVTVAAACGSTPIIDETKVQELIEEDLAEQLGEPISDASCPRIREPERGQMFECTAVVDGQTVRFAGEVIDPDEGQVWVENADAVLPRTELEGLIVDDFEAQLDIGLEVDCGDDRVIVAAPGSSFRCDIFDELGDAALVRVDVLDAQGNIEFELEVS